MKKAIAPPVILAVASRPPLNIIAGKKSSVLINEKLQSLWLKIISINQLAGETSTKGTDGILNMEADWYNNYE